MSAESEKFLINVTNFINPHMFHFKLENLVGLQEADIENQLAKYANAKNWELINGFTPKQNEIVAAYILEWSKWVRAQVDLIIEENQEKQYIVWCIDQGVAMKLNFQSLLPIPNELEMLPATSFVGGLSKCVPIEKRLNFAKMEYETIKIQDFSEFIVDYARQCIEEAARIYFIPLQKIGNHIFGDIHIRKYDGSKSSLLHELQKRDGIKIDEHHIPLGIEEWNTLKKQRYENCHGHLNVRNIMKNVQDNVGIRKKAKSKMSVCSNDLDDDDRMVLDWSRQNDEYAQKMEKDLSRRFDKVINSLNEYAMSYEIERKKFGGMYNLGSLRSVHRSNWTIGIERFDSTATLTEVQSSTSLVTEKPRMSRLAEKLKAASIATNSEPKIIENTKKTVFIPSGFERDILDFQKYNGM